MTTALIQDEILYENPLAGAEDLKAFRAEGPVALSFPRGRMRLESAREPDRERKLHANFLLWCDHDFPDHIAVSWDFRPLTDAGLAMFWIAARGRNGEDLFDPALAPRDGDYAQYKFGDINALHVSYYRRNPKEIGFQTCNLRKSHGVHFVAQGGDPLPGARDALPAYRIEVVKSGPLFRFSINDLVLIDWYDEGKAYGPVLEGGKIGFRQMGGLIAEYANLKVQSVHAE